MEEKMYNFENDPDLNILSKAPQIDNLLTLEISPLAPISMVRDIPGSHYKTLLTPDKQILCGLIENLLGWHFSIEDRKSLIAEMQKVRKNKSELKENKESRSGYIPLLLDFFELRLVTIEAKESPLFYNDLWRRFFRRKDEVKNQAGGTMNIDYSLVVDKQIRLIQEKEMLESDDISRISFFYGTPTYREYISFRGVYKCLLCVDGNLKRLIESAIPYMNLVYLGNSEGWVNVEVN